MKKVGYLCRMRMRYESVHVSEVKGHTAERERDGRLH